jgi:hypothetical protein
MLFCTQSPGIRIKGVEKKARMIDAIVESVFYIFNLCEGLLWTGIGVGFVVVLVRKRRNTDLMIGTALLFLAFGLSDFVEIHTGGWYKPWWLLLWKASCLAGFAAVYALFRRRWRTETEPIP